MSESVPSSLTGFQWPSDYEVRSCKNETCSDKLTTSSDTLRAPHNPLVAGSNPAGPTMSEHVLTLWTCRKIQQDPLSGCGVSETCAPFNPATFVTTRLSRRAEGLLDYERLSHLHSARPSLTSGGSQGVQRSTSVSPRPIFSLLQGRTASRSLSILNLCHVRACSCGHPSGVLRSLPSLSTNVRRA